MDWSSDAVRVCTWLAAGSLTAAYAGSPTGMRNSTQSSIRNLGVTEIDCVQKPTIPGSGRIVLDIRAASMSSRGSIARKGKYDLVIQYPSTATKRVFLWICRNRQHHMLRA